MTVKTREQLIESLEKSELFVAARARAKDDIEKNKIESYAIAMLNEFSRVAAVLSGSLNVVKQEIGDQK